MVNPANHFNRSRSAKMQCSFGAAGSPWQECDTPTPVTPEIGHLA
jgi:hypothetical protein